MIINDEEKDQSENFPNEPMNIDTDQKQQKICLIIEVLIKVEHDMLQQSEFKFRLFFPKCYPFTAPQIYLIEYQCSQHIDFTGLF